MAVQFTDREITLNISDYGEGTVRVRACLGADKPAFRSFAVLPERKERAFAACGDTLRTEDGLTEAVAEDLSLSVLDSRGRVVHRDVPGRAFRRDAMGRFVHTFAVDGYWHIYGLGERAGQLNRFGQSYRLDLRDAIGYDAASTDPLYKQIPFIIRKEPFKLITDKTRFTLSQQVIDIIALGHQHAVRYKIHPGSGHMIHRLKILSFEIPCLLKAPDSLPPSCAGSDLFFIQTIKTINVLGKYSFQMKPVHGIPFFLPKATTLLLLIVYVPISNVLIYYNYNMYEKKSHVTE